MSLRYPGGLITKTPTVPTTTSAPGIWTLEQALEYIKAGTWPIGSDPYFEYVTLLLHGDGTNGAQNNTFLDSSTNNFTITRNGDTTQGTFSPFSRPAGEWSNYFSSSAIYAASNAAFSIGTGNFTLEAWIYPLNWTGDGTFSIVYSNPSGSGGLMLGRNGSNFVIRAYSVGDILQYGTLPTLNTWTHVVAVRSGTTISLYYNGTRVATTTSSHSFAQAAAYVGKDGPSGGAVYAGYVSNLRLVNGTAVYDPTQTSLTVPTSPLTAVSNTSLLVCQNNRFKDNSTNNFSISTEGSPSVQVFNPFNPTAPYDTATNGGSGYFDGTGDYLTAPADIAFNFGTGNYTVEGWIYTASTTWGLYETGGLGSKDQFVCDAGTLYWGYGDAGFLGVSNFFTSQHLNQWVHVAVCRDGSSQRYFRNGEVIATITSTASYGSSTNPPNIGRRSDNIYFLNGYMSGVRIVKGTAVYTSAFTPPTAPPTAITNTSLLLNYTNGGIFDNAAMNDMVTVGNAQVSTTQFKYGDASMSFDGTGDQLNLPSSQNYAFGTGDYTVEFWLRLNTATASYPKIWMITSAVSSGTQVLGMQFGDAGYGYRMSLYINDSYIDLSSSGVTQTTFLNTWKHVAMVRSSGTLTIYVDGTSVYSAANTTNFSGPYFLQIGGSHGYNINGYLDDFRITKGYARYTANFTPPVAPFPNK